MNVEITKLVHDPDFSRVHVDELGSSFLVPTELAQWISSMNKRYEKLYDMVSSNLSERQLFLLGKDES